MQTTGESKHKPGNKWPKTGDLSASLSIWLNFTLFSFHNVKVDKQIGALRTDRPVAACQTRCLDSTLCPADACREGGRLGMEPRPLQIHGRGEGRKGKRPLQKGSKEGILSAGERRF